MPGADCLAPRPVGGLICWRRRPPVCFWLPDCCFHVPLKARRGSLERVPCDATGARLRMGVSRPVLGDPAKPPLARRTGGHPVGSKKRSVVGHTLGTARSPPARRAFRQRFLRLPAGSDDGEHESRRLRRHRRHAAARSVGFEREPADNGERLVWLEPHVLNKLSLADAKLRAPRAGESLQRRSSLGWPGHA